MTIPLQFASLYNGQEVIVWSDCRLDCGTDFLFGNMVFVCDAYVMAIPFAGTAAEEIQFFSAENPELSQDSPVKPGVG